MISNLRTVTDPIKYQANRLNTPNGLNRPEIDQKWVLEWCTLELDRKPNPKFVHFARCEPHAVGDQLDFINFNPFDSLFMTHQILF